MITLTVAESIDRQLAKLAGRQSGYVTRPQLLDLSLGAEAVR